MPSFSQDDFMKAWRYAVSEEFKDSNENDFQYAKGGKKEWGDEFKRLDFAQSPIEAAISSDHKTFAVASAREIHIFDENFSPTRVLRGHAHDIDSLAFSPRDSNILVSGDSSPLGTKSPKSTIVLWDLQKMGQLNHEVDSDAIAEICNTVADTALDRLQRSNLIKAVDSSDHTEIASTLRGALQSAVARSNVSGNVQVHGRLSTSFQSSVFSPSGKFLMYLPGERPNSNGDDQWDVRIFSTQKKADLFTLSGHRDAIMWTGYDMTEKFIGTAAWDQTFKVWDASNGQIKYTFHTNGQNWTAGFSPDSHMFAGLCGDATVHIYSLLDGSELWNYSTGKSDWSRALSWSPSGKFLAYGSRHGRVLALLDVEEKKEVQRKSLSDAKSIIKGEKYRSFVLGFIETSHVTFAQSGRKLIYFIGGDGSAEVLDLVDCRKWRFARAGTESYEHNIDGQLGKKTSGNYIGGMTTWENHESSCIMIATVDRDAVRIWKLKYDGNK